jgi:hypothetical protein
MNVGAIHPALKYQELPAGLNVSRPESGFLPPPQKSPAPMQRNGVFRASITVAPQREQTSAPGSKIWGLLNSGFRILSVCMPTSRFCEVADYTRANLKTTI